MAGQYWHKDVVVQSEVLPWAAARIGKPPERIPKCRRCAKPERTATWRWPNVTRLTLRRATVPMDALTPPRREAALVGCAARDGSAAVDKGRKTLLPSPRARSQVGEAQWAGTPGRGRFNGVLVCSRRAEE